MVRAIQMRTAEEAITRYREYVELYYQLQGSLYPAIAFLDLIDLRNKCLELRPSADVPLPPPPDPSGYAPRRSYAEPTV